MYFSTAMQGATNIVVDQQRVITKIYFPRVVLPIAAVLSGLLDFAISFVVFLAMMVYYRIVPTTAIIWLPGFTLLAILTALGVGLWLSAFNALYRDVRYVLPFLVEFWMFASPVAYAISLVPEKWRWLYGVNPMAGGTPGVLRAATGPRPPPGRLLRPLPTAAVLCVLYRLVSYP